jgi:hypothetical protein
MHKPFLENRLGDGLKRYVGLAVQFDFVVQRREDGGNAGLGVEVRPALYL